jgi:protocatechuate 3,4-dioxygenase beta subunit
MPQETIRRVALFGLVALVAGGAVGAGMWAKREAPSESARVPPPAAGSTAIICNANEAGERLLIDGIVVNASGEPIAGAKVGAFNADAQGLYNPPNSGTREPRIQGEVRTGPDGRFQFVTVRPGPYPGGDEPGHVHLTVTADGFQLKYQTFWLEGDPLITEARLKRAHEYENRNPHDISVIARPNRDRGVLMVEQRIVLNPE